MTAAGRWWIVFLLFLPIDVFALYDIALSSHQQPQQAEEAKEQILDAKPKADIYQINTPGKGIGYPMVAEASTESEPRITILSITEKSGMEPSASPNADGSSGHQKTAQTETPSQQKKAAKAPTVPKQAAMLYSSDQQGNEPVIKGSSDRLFPGDVIHVTIAGQKEMTADYDIDPDGTIYLLSGPLTVYGLNTSDVEQLILKSAKAYVGKEGQVEVDLVESKRYILIQGGVRYPGWYRMTSETTLDDMLATAGGLMSGVERSEVVLQRKAGNQLQTIPIGNRVQLEPNDVISVPTPKDYIQKVDNGDLLFVSIPQEQVQGTTEVRVSPEQKVKQNQIEVDRNGYIYLPEYGHIFVRDLSTEQIASEISQRLPKYLAKGGRIQVSIIEKRHWIQLLGHVSHPGWYNISEFDNVQTALGAAGGAIDGAIMTDIAIIRKIGAETRKTKVNLYQFSITGDARLLPPLHESDAIFVPISSSFGGIKRTLSQWDPPQEKLEQDTKQKVRVFGAVNNSGVYEAKEDLNLLDILLMAGGNRDDADLTRVLIIRDGRATTYDIKTLIDGKSIEKIPEVRAGDTVYVNYVAKEAYKKQDPTKQVRVIGAVYRPGIFDPIENMDLLDALALAGGTRDDAELSSVQILRGSGSIQEKYDFKELLKTFGLPGGPQMPKIFPKDTVYVAFVAKDAYKREDTRQMIRIFGAVNKPGVYAPIENMDLLEILTLAYGIRDDANLGNIQIIRGDTNEAEVYDLNDIFLNLRKGNPVSIPKLRARDTVFVGYVEKADYQKNKAFYTAGKVRHEGEFSIPESGLTPIQAIALAGGLDEWADPENIVIIRMIKGKQQNIPYNYYRGLSGKVPEINIRIMENDTIYVP